MGSARDILKQKRNMPLPKYAQEYSTAECEKFQPCKVDLPIILRQEDLTPVTLTVFLRAQDPTEAQWMAYAVFAKVAGIEADLDAGKDPQSLWPQIECGTATWCIKLSEDEYMEEWKKAQYFPCKWLGDTRNPTAFCYFEPGWDKGILKKAGSSIIVPSKKDIEKILKPKKGKKK